MRSHVGVVKDEIKRMADLVESYLQFGRPPTLARETVDLDALLDTRLATITAELDLKRIAIRRDRGDGHLPPLFADPEQLGRSLMNLFRNALDAMPGGGML